MLNHFALAGLAVAVATSAQAMPRATLQADSVIIQVREGCGIGMVVVDGQCVSRHDLRVERRVERRDDYGSYGNAPYGNAAYGDAPYGNAAYGNIGYGTDPNGAYDTSGGDVYILHGNYMSEADAVAYCAQRFRSYDVGSQTFLAHSGERVSCPQ
jgi:hypothetical protein